MSAHSHRAGYALILGATLFWGTSAVAARDITRLLPPLTLAQLAALGSWLVLTTSLLALRPALLRIHPADAWRFAVLGIFGFAAGSGCINTAIYLTNAPTAVVIQYIAPALVLMWNWLRGTERLSLAKCLAVAACVAGCAVTAGLFNHGLRFHPAGIAAAIGAAVAFAFIAVFSRTFAGTYHPAAFAAHTFLPTSLALALLPSGRDWTPFAHHPSLIWQMALFVVLLAVAPTVLFFWGVPKVSAVAVTILCSFEIVVTALLSWWWLGEPMLWIQAGGAALIAAAIVLIEVARRDDQRADRPTAAAKASPSPPE
ncbi:MAG: DMT family transporter [Candidatus Sumerlaeaceae bacterium]|nr:DMT family transporter [Candidatus Sumerlaeaceae bacterium]